MTIDDATLRSLFPGAPADLSVPKDVGTLYKARLKAAGGSRRPWYIGGWVLLLVIAAGALAGGSPAAGLVVGGLAIAVLVVVLVVQHGRASKEFFQAYATARGLRGTEDGHVSAAIPLFKEGEKREWPRVLSGSIAGNPANLAHYTYTTVSTDSDGNRTETDHDYTVLHFELPSAVAARFAGVYLGPKTLSFGALQDKLAHDRAVQLESSEFHDRYKLRVVDDQDDIALYELFSPPFIHMLATTAKVYWQQRGADLVFWKKGHETEAADLDQFCLESAPVLRRYLEEDR